MASKRHKPEEVVAKLRQVDVLVSQGQSVAEAVRAIGVTEVTYYRWRREFGGLKSEQVKRLKDLEAENARLRKAVADLTLDKQILAEAARGMYGPPLPGKGRVGDHDSSCVDVSGLSRVSRCCGQAMMRSARSVPRYWRGHQARFP
jgi:putative transposase